jgi:pimeloyl-ACP methyl ester carboxylesterase
MSGRPTFALLHGGGQGSWVWDDVVERLTAKSARVRALDVPACGIKRGRDVTALDADDVTRERVADIKVADVANVTIVGHSLAGARSAR